MPAIDAWYEARQSMVDAVVADLYGSDSESRLSEPPLDRFIVGILHPRSADGEQEVVELADEIPDDESGDAADSGDDPGVSFANLRYPSTMGMTFGVVDSTPALEIEVRADRYEPGATTVTEDSVAVGTRAYGARVTDWQRVEFRPETVSVSLEEGHQTLALTDGLQLRVVSREPRRGIRSVTVVLVNTHLRPEKAIADDLCWFRPSLRVVTPDGEYVDRRPEQVFQHLDDDERSGDLLYRRERHLAVGHGVAVVWEESDRVTVLETTFFPSHDLLLAEADREDVIGLEMANLSVAGTFEPLERLVASYEKWIGDRRSEVHQLDLSAASSETAARHLLDATEVAQRMRRGIEVLKEDPVADHAFRVMNKVMREQRIRQEMLRQGADSPLAGAATIWRPFQIAFILINVEGLAIPASRDRDIADLLWFPTGGGKTEAYLGLIAFTLVLRRLRGVGEDGKGAGVGVIMRYTLRLLTLQQFERASGLICALEHYRLSASEMTHKAPFSIGLWVGQGATPNNLDDAARALKKKADGDDPGELGDPVQLLRCPWCGVTLKPNDYVADRAADQLRVICPNVDCDFHQGLPVRLIDSDVYSARPSLVIGTVDKFAMLAWNEKSGGLFGLGSDEVPDLIIQDELHLISGPLGTLVGLYETAIDSLATSVADGIRPKLVASTATIRRAATQVRAVFARDSRQFPPPGLEAGDSFFAVDARPQAKGTRRYVGLMAPSTSHATLLVRTYASLLQGSKDLDTSNEVRDSYWTLLGYFNSLRVLGAAFIQSIDDVRDRILLVARRAGTEPRDTRSPNELTSRVKSTDIPRELGFLATSYPDPESPDIVLATNMISVGMDIDRLGLMAVMGQPQTTSEYIQASSRVGRKHPGLVFTMYNASRSRDLSHYENFTTYHRSLYKQVEATGATPFSPRALDRGLHGLLVILARHTIAGARGDKSVSVPVASGDLTGLIDVVLARVASVSQPGAERDQTVLEVRTSLERLIGIWSNAVGNGEVNQYARWNSFVKGVKSLMIPAGMSISSSAESQSLADSFPPEEVPWSTLTSLRNVDRESTLKIVSGAKQAKEAADNDAD